MSNDIHENNPLFKLKPFAHQLKELNASWNDRYYAVFWEMGTGKSKFIIDTAVQLYTHQEIDGLLIVAPKGMYMGWINDQIPEHMPEQVDYFKAYHSSSTNRVLKRRLAMACSPSDGTLDILCVNVEALSTGKKAKALVESFLETHTTMMVIDESQTIKSPKANRTKYLLKIAHKAKYRRILSGTPITQSPLDLFSQFEWLERGITGHKSYYSFRSYFAEIVQMRLGTRTFPKITGYRNMDEIQKMIARNGSRYLKTECVDLPEKLYSTRYVELTPEQKEAYEKIRDEAVLMFDNGEMITVTNVLTAIQKLQQITCGHIKTEDGATIDIKSNRVNVLMETVSEVSGKAIIWCGYQRDVELVMAALNAEYEDGVAVDYYGKTKDADREEHIHRFKNDPSCRFLVGTAACGGKGLNLTVANTVIYYSNTYNLEHRLQSEDRAHRIGQKNSVYYIDLACMDTVDTKIIDALRKKKNLADSLLDDWRDLLTPLA